MKIRPSELEIALAKGPDDVAAASEVLLRSFAGHENARLGASYARAFLRAFEIDRARSLHVARVEGRIVGFTTGEPGGARAERYRHLRPAAAAAFFRRPWLLLNPAILHMAGARLIGGSGDAPPPACWFLPLIGVDPDFHGQGIGRELLRAFEEDGRRRGFPEAILFVLEANPGARALYESSGWRIAGRPGRGRLVYQRSL